MPSFRKRHDTGQAFPVGGSDNQASELGAAIRNDASRQAAMSADNAKKGSERERARSADLIVLPSGVKGTNCGNCMYFDRGTCRNKALMYRDGQEGDKMEYMPVAANYCCVYWDAKGTKRVADLL